MNHDATHCLDYAEGKCPGTCFRAKLTRDLDFLVRIGRFPVTMAFSWAHLKGTDECRRKEG